MTLLVATRSPGKQREVRRLLASAGFPIVFPDEAGVSADPAEDHLELHDTFEANARAKAEYFARRTGLPTVADDSGLEV
ncbi:MAG TPA: non-canonical purine NTP pyrophosphatase, partial [Gemmatimonadales bacterium]|nr:non-canonical purine NTP pyrophosphatase [Gemmatimonadales bacterium]